MQANIFLVLCSLLLCLAYRFVVTNFTFADPHADFYYFIKDVDFPTVLINGILSYLLFAGALHCDLSMFRQLKYSIFPLAFFGTILSTALVGFGLYGTSMFLHADMSLLYCMIFGAIISPTDPIAVLSMLKELGAAKYLKETLAGESLFNDGVGIVIFMTLIQMVGGQSITTKYLILTFMQLTVGGILYGLLLGYIGFKIIDALDHNLEFTFILTLWITTTGYALAEILNVSGPLAMVVSGLIIGDKLKNWHTREYLLAFWDVIDNALNCFLFLLIGLELIVIDLPLNLLSIFAITTSVTLIARFISVYASLLLFKKKNKKSLKNWIVISWGGLRGGLAIALALSIPNKSQHEFLILITYTAVLFSIIVQGLTIKPLIHYLNSRHAVDR